MAQAFFFLITTNLCKMQTACRNVRFSRLDATRVMPHIVVTNKAGEGNAS